MCIKRVMVIAAALFTLSVFTSCYTGKKGRYERCPTFGKAIPAKELQTLKHA
ncbi:MAG: hypothetical protein WCM76_08660 [Bacteroidota bacterium]